MSKFDVRKVVKHIFINGVRFEVTNLDKESMRSFNGKLNRDKTELSLSTDVSEEYAKITFIHEVLHGLSNTVLEDPHDLKEQQIVALSTCLMGFLRDPRNKKAVEWMLRDTSV